ncbi:MAG: NADH-quinone oxidoreductase subunit C [Bacteroidetes bacterium]|nr:NADH-quinone oxidoreductase subunit C [Bacteroidota bacterium]
MKDTITISQQPYSLSLNELPIPDYSVFCKVVTHLLSKEAAHCVNYFAVPDKDSLLFLCLIANDEAHTIDILAHKGGGPLASLTPVIPALHIFEREIHENYGVQFEGHPWLKPVRFARDSNGNSYPMDDYPFYSIDSHELHEVGVGPVHAGVIEPGHFRFLCNGEKVLHLEIQLGYQHRGVEKLMGEGRNGLQRAVCAENIAGDTAVGHSIAHASALEALTGVPLPVNLYLERAIALELERMAMHIGDTAALCTDVAYQLGQVVNESLRTIVINTTQLWCGNRFGKGLIRPFGTHYPLSGELTSRVKKNLKEAMKRFLPMSDRMLSMPSLLARYEGIGIVTREQVVSIGAVGMAARMAGLNRDIRHSHPDEAYRTIHFYPAVRDSGDVMARALLRRMEVEASCQLILDMLTLLEQEKAELPLPDYSLSLPPDSLSFSMVEGWRGEICHTILTDSQGKIRHYKVKDPSLHNWMALTLAVRDQEISDFPVCNKSFNLSYCGHDL